LGIGLGDRRPGGWRSRRPGYRAKADFLKDNNFESLPEFV
jgi:hypothetical protein